MNWSELGKQLGSIGFPLIGEALAGPAGATIGKLVANQFSFTMDTDSKIDWLSQAIEKDPEAALKLAELEKNTKVELQQLMVTAEKNRLEQEVAKMNLDVANTKSARENNVESHSNYPQFLSTLISIGFFACIYWIAAYKQDSDDHDVLYLMLGVIGTSFNAVVNYWLGSSYQKLWKQDLKNDNSRTTNI